jgi:heme-degrading monooxygenase HmoA
LKRLLGGRKLIGGPVAPPGRRPNTNRGWIVHARTTSIQAQPSCIDAGIAHVRDEVMPALAAMDGFIGLSLLVDRKSGRCIAASAWETEEAERASAERIGPVRDRAAQVFGGTATAEAWEIGLLHRDHHSNDGACVRATWATGDPAMADQNIEYFKSSVLPDLESLEGFCSASLLINRSTGVGVSSVTFDSREAMERNRERATSLKAEKIGALGVEELDEAEFELALAHLRVPELV